MSQTDLQQVRALGLVSSRRNLLTWTPSTGMPCPDGEDFAGGKWIVDSDSSEAETPPEEDTPMDSKISHQMEELDYLALDLVQVLPGERVHRLLETLRQQDSIMHELLGRAKTLYKENKNLKENKTKKPIPVWALPLPGEKDNQKDQIPIDPPGSAGGKKMRKSRSAVANLIGSRCTKETVAEKHKSIRSENRFLEKLEWAMRVNNGNEDSAPKTARSDAPREEAAPNSSEEKAKGDLCATASSRSTSASCDEDSKVESLQANIKNLTESNSHLTETNRRLQAQLETALMELSVQTKVARAAQAEVDRLKAPRTYNLRLTPARYRGGMSMNLPVGGPGSSPHTPSAAGSPSADLARFESSPSNIPKLDVEAMAAAAMSTTSPS